MKFKITLMFLFFSAFLVDQAFGTHIRAGEITAQRVSCSSREFLFTITGYIDLESTVEFGGGQLDFGDGSEPVNLREAADLVLEQDLGNLVGIVVFQIRHTYGANGEYLITYGEPNRNANILNMDNSVNTPFFIETKINLDPFLGCNNTPVLLIPPIDGGCIGVTFFHNPGAFDVDGDSISYEIVIPQQDEDIFVNQYVFPNDQSFGGTREDGSVPTLFNIDQLTGDITWDAPAIAGEYNISFLVKEWRLIAGEPFLLGYVTRDMQIIIEDCENERPELTIPEDVCVEAGTLVQGLVIGEDPDGDDVILESFSGVYEFATSPATFVPDPPVAQPVPATAQFDWQTVCGHIREQPYQVRFKITDVPDEGPRLVDFETWNITVVGPAPENLSATLNPGREIELNWDTYSCTNAELIQVWRRVDSFDFPFDQCLTGIPEGSGYELIEVIDDISSTTYTDTGLDPGVNYCYRLVAVFPLPNGGESYASLEVCATLEADAPVITNVDIDNTGSADGEVIVRWTPPFQIDQVQFPPPYTYEVYRADGLSGDINLSDISGRISDTTYIDTGLNTLDETFNYRILLYDDNNTLIDTSAIASTVRLEPTPLFKKIELQWVADVPWSNISKNSPMHYIWRDNSNPGDPASIELIDSVNVFQTGFYYLDSGQFNNVELVDTQEYCYFVTTFGSYGNPLIDEPLINRSQIICVQPNDTIPPCAPTLEIDAVNCDEFLVERACDFNNYRNNLNWDFEDVTCSADVRSYNLYFSDSGDDETFELIAPEIPVMSFEHGPLFSYAGCYYVTAIDRSNNESEPSNIVCNDNCPNYVLPNVFTPNGDNINDTFTAFDDSFGVENFDQANCPRFVRKVDFTVYNRWGKQVFRFESGGENSILIEWDGRSSDGNQLSSGVYYYVAEVTFDVRVEAESTQTLNGWIQLLR